jgi:predicted PurR-regulated permease PerM
MAIRDISKEKKVRLAIAAAALILMLYLVCAVLWSFVVTFFIAFLGYVFLKPIYKFFRMHNLGKAPSGLLAMTVGMIFVGIPLVLISGVLLNEAIVLFSPANVVYATNLVSTALSDLENRLPMNTLSPTINQEVTAAISKTLSSVSTLLLSSLQGIGDLAIKLLVLLFVLYYLLTGEENIKMIQEKLLPFSSKNTEKLMKEFHRVTYSVVISSGLIGLIQAVPLTLVFMYFNVPGAVFWGFFAFLLTFIPFVGIPFVWIPVMIAEFLQGNTDAAMGILLAGIVIAIIENGRPLLQKKIGDINPLISLLGVIIGVVYFGILGVLIGPLLLSYTILMLGMFVEEYV